MSRRSGSVGARSKEGPLRFHRRQRPRRRNPVFRVLAVLSGMLFLSFMAVERFPEHLGALPELTARRMIEGPASHVRDGDTIEVSGVPVRFGSLDCAERNTREGQISTARMRELIAGQVLVCALNGRTSYDRSIGRCTLPDGSDLAARMIREGLCGRYW